MNKHFPFISLEATCRPRNKLGSDYTCQGIITRREEAHDEVKQPGPAHWQPAAAGAHPPCVAKLHTVFPFQIRLEMAMRLDLISTVHLNYVEMSLSMTQASNIST